MSFNSSVNSPVTLDNVMAALRAVKDPSLQRDILSLGIVRDLKIDAKKVSLKLVLATAAPSVHGQMKQQVKDALIRSAGASEVEIQVEVDAKKGAAVSDKSGIPGVKHIIAVSSGKGGVGKSTVSVNLATALSQMGFAVGLLDSDVYGPNIPTMMGVSGQAPEARMDAQRGEMILPLEAYGVKVMSMGNLTRGDQPLVWRGPMLHGVVSQFLLKVDWGNLDYLVVDMPPGTGDVQLSLTQLVPVSGAVLVTTPQEVSLQDVRKAYLMFEKVNVPVLGFVENMSYFVCGNCKEKHEIFGSGGGKNLAEKYRTRLLAQVPLSADVRESGDAGSPVVVRQPQSLQARSFFELARSVSNLLSDQSLKTGTHSGSPEITIGQF